MRKESHAATYHAAVKRRGRAFVVGDGSVAWSWSSIVDLADAVVFLMDQAISHGDERSSQVRRNMGGYYFMQVGDVTMMERAKAVSERLGLGEVESVPVERAAHVHSFGPLMWGCGVTFKADRLTVLGWKPKDLGWRVSMEEVGVSI